MRSLRECQLKKRNILLLNEEFGISQVLSSSSCLLKINWALSIISLFRKIHMVNFCHLHRLA